MTNMLGYLLSPVLQIEDVNGIPLANGKIYVYNADTTNLATTYSNYEGTVNTNPIILDTAGHAVVIADDSIYYDIEIKDDADALLFSVKHVKVGAEGGSQSTSATVVSAGYGIKVAQSIQNNTTVYTVSADPAYIATQNDLLNKQDKLTPGTNIDITDNVISVTGISGGCSLGYGLENVDGLTRISNNGCSTATKEGLALGKNCKTNGASFVHGKDNNVSGNYNAVFGENNKINNTMNGNYNLVEGSGNDARESLASFVGGTNNCVATANKCLVFGNQNDTSYLNESNILGSRNIFYNPQNNCNTGNNVLGIQNTIDPSSTFIGNTILGYSNYVAGNQHEYNIIGGEQNRLEGNYGIANTILGDQNYMNVGTRNFYNIMMGSYGRLYAVSGEQTMDNKLIGYENNLYQLAEVNNDTQHNTLFGHNNIVSAKRPVDHIDSIGNQNKIIATAVSSDQPLNDVHQFGSYNRIDVGNNEYDTYSYFKMTQIGNNNSAIGSYEMTQIGNNNRANNGNYSGMTIGNNNSAGGVKSYIFGRENKVTGDNVHVYGRRNEVNGNDQDVFGENVYAKSNQRSHIFGNVVTANDCNVSIIDAIYNGTIHSANSAVILSDYPRITKADNAVVIGTAPILDNSKNATIVGGYNQIEDSDGVTVIGYNNRNYSSFNTNIIGYENTANSSTYGNTNILGQNNEVNGHYNAVIGVGNLVTKNYDYVLGDHNTVIDNRSNVIGSDNKVSSYYSNVIGNLNEVRNTSRAVFIAGESNSIRGAQSAACVIGNMNGSENSAAKTVILAGYRNNNAIMSGGCVAMGEYNQIRGKSQFVTLIGQHLTNMSADGIAGPNCVCFGKYNVGYNDSVLEIGLGGNAIRKTIFRIDENGNVSAAGAFFGGITGMSATNNY